MKIPEQFDPIRPFEPDELPDVFDRLLQNEQFCSVLAYFYPDVPKEALAAKMHACNDNLDFQKTFCYGFLYSCWRGSARDATSTSHRSTPTAATPSSATTAT